MYIKLEWFSTVMLFLLALSSNAAGQDTAENEFMRGYIFSKLEDRFNAPIEFDIQDNQVILYRWPEDLKREEIILYLENIQSYPVLYDRLYQDSRQGIGVTLPLEEGDFLPELNPFFPTMLAQPQIIGYSAGYRSYDKIFRTSCIPVSVGDQFSLYQFKTLTRGHLYFGIEACVWAIFEAKSNSLALINADYFVALPLTYINNNFMARLRVYHESSHLGDEFILEKKKIHRRNPSMEVVDLSLAYEWSNLTVFLGYSRVLRSDEGFRIKPNGLYYGFNFYPDCLKINYKFIQASPYISAYFLIHEDNNWIWDNSVAIGYQWDKSYGHKLRVYLEGHSGFSADGQFSKKKTCYVALKLLYGY